MPEPDHQPGHQPGHPQSVAHDDEHWMRRALAEAQRARAHGDVPVGAIVTLNGDVVGRGSNGREHENDPIAHAEILALKDAARHLNRWRLSDCTLYVTLEPCFMCAGAVVNARVGRLVYGARDAKAGAVESLANVCTDERLNHLVDVTSGVLAEDASLQLRDFFREARERGKRDKLRRRELPAAIGAGNGQANE